MREIESLSRGDIKDIKMLVFDVDGVLVPRGTEIKEHKNGKLEMKVKKIQDKEINLIKDLHDRGFKINISSGRNLYVLKDMFYDVLPFVSITYENGSATWEKGRIIQHYNSFDKLYEIKNKLRDVDSECIKGFEPKEFIITIHCTERVKEIEEIVDEYDSLYCIWNSEAYDIGVKRFQTKAMALSSLVEKYNLNSNNVLVIGDNYNDKNFESTVGIVVSADKTRVSGDFYIGSPGEILMRKILEETIDGLE
jgi:HAD superfamily hydrolase (TIGR01484 family)